jgi:transposase-like protein
VRKASILGVNSWEDASFVARMVADAPRPGSRYAAEAVSRIQFCALNGWRRCYRVERGFHTPASLGES